MSATLLKISHTITSDDFYGLPWPPPDSNVLWAVVRRANGRTLWRALQIAQSDRCHGLPQFPDRQQLNLKG